MTLEISESEPWQGIDRKALARCGDRLLDAMDSRDAVASLHLAGDDEIHRMNRRFRHMDRPTDVLSFLSDEESAGNGELGEIIISVETARRQAGNLGQGLMERMVELLAHGILHLHGLDHEGGEEEEWDRGEGKLAGLIRELKEEVRVRPGPGRTR